MHALLKKKTGETFENDYDKVIYRFDLQPLKVRRGMWPDVYELIKDQLSSRNDWPTKLG